MKRLAIALAGFALAACNLSSSPSSNDAKGGTLTTQQSKEVVEYLDELCPDTFCEGEFEYDFESFSCDEKKCTLGFSAQHHERKGKKKANVSVKRPEQLIDEEIEGPSDELFENISDALIDWEESNA